MAPMYGLKAAVGGGSNWKKNKKTISSAKVQLGSLHTPQRQA